MANILTQIKVGNTTYNIEPVTAYLPLSDLGNTTFKVTRGASQSTKNTGYWAGMLHSTQGGSPTLPSPNKWWHIISMDWTGTDTNNWISQLALPTQDGGVPYYRKNDRGGGVSIDDSTWHAFITDENIGSQNVNYANSAGNADTVDNEHASSFAHIGADNNLLTHTDEFTFASSGFSGAVWLNYRTAGGTNGNITEYKLGNGAGKALGSIIHSGNIGSQSVNYATSSHLLRTYSAGNGSHGADYYLKCRHNVDGNDRFKLQIIRSDGSITHSTSVDYANSAGSVAWGNVTGKPSTYTPASHTHSYLPLAGGTLTGTLGFKSNYLIKPVADFRTQSDRYTGAITIALPASISNTMVSMWIDVYNYSTNTSFSVHVGGYTYTNSTWQHNPFAMVYGATHTIRLGHNGTNFVIYIGETNSTWNYPQISVRDVILGHQPAYDNWKKDWAISFSTSFSNVSATINNYAWTTKNFTPPTSLPASDVYAWAKASTKPTYTKAEVGLGNVDNTADANKNVNYANSANHANSANRADYADSAGSAGSVAWGNIGGKPSTFPTTVDSLLKSNSNNPVRNSTIYSAFSSVVDFDSNKYTYGNNGSWRLRQYHATGNTLDIRYGNCSINAQEKTYDVSFSTPMDTSNYAIVFGIYRDNRNSWFWSPLVKKKTEKGFTVYVRGNTSGDNSGTLFYIAIKSN